MFDETEFNKTLLKEIKQRKSDIAIDIQTEVPEYFDVHPDDARMLLDTLPDTFFYDYRNHGDYVIYNGKHYAINSMYEGIIIKAIDFTLLNDKNINPADLYYAYVEDLFDFCVEHTSFDDVVDDLMPMNE